MRETWEIEEKNERSTKMDEMRGEGRDERKLKDRGEKRLMQGN